MPRRRRLIIPGEPYHITHRGNHRSPILHTEEERRVYMAIMIRWAARTGVRIAAFVLMLNHVHFVAVSPTEWALSEWIKNGHREYSHWYNSTRGQTGLNWEGRYFSVVMDEPHCLNALRYVEQNPVRAGLCKFPWDAKWSSAAWHAGMGPQPTLLSLDLRPAGTSPKAWREALTQPTPEAFRERLFESQNRGMPLASDEWIDRMEARLGLKLRPRGRGRPGKVECATV